MALLSNLLTVSLCAVFISCVALTHTEGLWGNTIRLVNAVAAALLATNFFEPLASWLEDLLPSYKYYWDFLALWGLFAAFAMIFGTLTDRVSRVMLRFPQLVEQIGSWVLSAVIGWVMVAFTLTSLHTAPLGRNFLFGGFQPEQRMFFGLAPDRKWTSFVRQMSRGPLGSYASRREGSAEANVFDPRGLFIDTYARRRSELEGHPPAAATTQR
jgi:hypothetical protein